MQKLRRLNFFDRFDRNIGSQSHVIKAAHGGRRYLFFGLSNGNLIIQDSDFRCHVFGDRILFQSSGQPGAPNGAPAESQQEEESQTLQQQQQQLQQQQIQSFKIPQEVLFIGDCGPVLYVITTMGVGGQSQEQQQNQGGGGSGQNQQQYNLNGNQNFNQSDSKSSSNTTNPNNSTGQPLVRFYRIERGENRVRLLCVHEIRLFADKGTSLQTNMSTNQGSMIVFPRITSVDAIGDLCLALGSDKGELQLIFRPFDRMNGPVVRYVSVTADSAEQQESQQGPAPGSKEIQSDQSPVPSEPIIGLKFLHDARKRIILFACTQSTVISYGLGEMSDIFQANLQQNQNSNSNGVGPGASGTSGGVKNIMDPDRIFLLHEDTDPQIKTQKGLLSNANQTCCLFPATGSLLVARKEGIFGYDADEGNLSAIPLEGNIKRKIVEYGQSFFACVSREELPMGVGGGFGSNSQTQQQQQAHIGNITINMGKIGNLVDGSGSNSKQVTVNQQQNSNQKPQTRDILTVCLSYPHVRFLTYHAVFPEILHIFQGFENSIFMVVRNNSSNSSSGIGGTMTSTTGPPSNNQNLQTQLIQLKEKSKNEQINLLIKKRLFEWASALAEKEGERGGVDQTLILEILKVHADTLFEKRLYEHSLQVYMKGISVSAQLQQKMKKNESKVQLKNQQQCQQQVSQAPQIESSYIVEKFLEVHKIGHIARYLRELHTRKAMSMILQNQKSQKSQQQNRLYQQQSNTKQQQSTFCEQPVEPGHTELLFKCYTRERDFDNINSFLEDIPIEVYDYRVALEVLEDSPACYDYAVRLAQKARDGSAYVRLLLANTGSSNGLNGNSTLSGNNNIKSSNTNTGPAQALNFLFTQCTDFETRLAILVGHGADLLTLFPKEISKLLLDIVKTKRLSAVELDEIMNLFFSKTDTGVVDDQNVSQSNNNMIVDNSDSKISQQSQIQPVLANDPVSEALSRKGQGYQGSLSANTKNTTESNNSTFNKTAEQFVRELVDLSNQILPSGSTLLPEQWVESTLLPTLLELLLRNLYVVENQIQGIKDLDSESNPDQQSQNQNQLQDLQINQHQITNDIKKLLEDHCNKPMFLRSALSLCCASRFQLGIVYCAEKLGQGQIQPLLTLLTFYLDKKDLKGMLETCRRCGVIEPGLWLQMMALISTEAKQIVTSQSTSSTDNKTSTTTTTTSRLEEEFLTTPQTRNYFYQVLIPELLHHITQINLVSGGVPPVHVLDFLSVCKVPLGASSQPMANPQNSSNSNSNAESMQNLNQNLTLASNGVRTYLKQALEIGLGSEIRKKVTKLSEDKRETKKMMYELENTYSATAGPVIFSSQKCHACGLPLECPSVHFFCLHAYHKYCLSSNSNSNTIDECPKCAKEYGSMSNVNNRSNLNNLNQCITINNDSADDFYKYLNANRNKDGGFGTISEYFGRNLFGEG